MLGCGGEGETVVEEGLCSLAEGLGCMGWAGPRKVGFCCEVWRKHGYGGWEGAGHKFLFLIKV